MLSFVVQEAEGMWCGHLRGMGWRPAGGKLGRSVNKSRVGKGGSMAGTNPQSRTSEKILLVSAELGPPCRTEAGL